MSWFGRKKEFIEDGDILAPDFESEFDNIADALNGLFQAGQVLGQTQSWSLGEEQTLSVTESKTISLSVPSLVLVWAQWGVEVVPAGGTKARAWCTLVVDGSANSAYGEAGNAAGRDQSSVGRSYVLKLGAGSHTLRLQVKPFSSAETIVEGNKTGFTYLILPDPEP